MFLGNETVCYNTTNSIFVETKESTCLPDVIKDAEFIISFANKMDILPISFRVRTTKKFSLFCLGYEYYYCIILEFKRVTK